MKTLRIVLVALVALAAGVLASANAQSVVYTLDTPNPQAGAFFGYSVAMGYVDDDSNADIVVGAPWQDVGGNALQGRAYVFSGADGSLLLTLDTPNPQEYAYFGESVAVGDVDDDGQADIAVGAFGEDVGDNEDEGRAYVFSGADGSPLFTLDTPNPQEYAGFGHSVAVGDVDDDWNADIIVGAPREDVGGNADQGRAYVFSGADGWPLFTLDTPNPQEYANFGDSVAVGYVDDDWNADIAVGAPSEDVGDNADQGRAYVFSGADGWPLFTMDNPNPQADADFGYSLAVGYVDDDWNADIAVGAPGQNVGGNDYQGRAYAFSGADASLLFTLDTASPQGYGYFGHSVAVGDVNGDGKEDIAVGAPWENVGDNDYQGRAYVFSGADGSLVSTLDTPNPQAHGHFGHSLAAGDVDDNGKAEIAVGAPQEEVGGNGGQGRAYIFSGPPGCQPGVDTDDDGFNDDVECYLGTDPLDNCPDDPSDDAWPLDMDNDTWVKLWDMLVYGGNFGLLYTDPGWDSAIQRLDLSDDGGISVVGDLWRFYSGMMNAVCDGYTPHPPARGEGPLVTMGIDPEITGNTPHTLGDLEACWRVDVPSENLGDGNADHTIDVYVTGVTAHPTGYDAWVTYDPDQVDPVDCDDLIKLPDATSYTNKMESRLNAAAAYLDSGSGKSGDGTLVRIGLDAISAGPACFAFGFGKAFSSAKMDYPTVVRVAMLAINEDCPTEDPDGDNVLGVCDNCPEVANPDQSDIDADGLGDVCDPDDDDDGICDPGESDTCTGSDNCPMEPNPGQADGDAGGGDGVGDVCDNCPAVYNPDQTDTDGDEIGNACDPDDDNDHMPDSYEEANTCLESLVVDWTDNYDDDELMNYAEMVIGTDPCLAEPELSEDSDGDLFSDGEERYIGTDPLDDCRDDEYDHAWPLDMNNDGISNMQDILNFAGRLKARVGEPAYWARLDFNADGITKMNDVLRYAGHVREPCT